MAKRVLYTALTFTILICLSCGFRGNPSSQKENELIIKNNQNRLDQQIGLNGSTNSIFSSVKTYRLFVSNEQQGYCYRTPSFVRSGKYVIALAQKRFGYTEGKTIPTQYKRPVRLSQQRIENAPACADESFISIVARIAIVPRSSATKELDVSNLKWSNEITLIDMNQYINHAIEPTSRFFEPPLYDYWLRLRANKFGKKSAYLACHDQPDCDSLMKRRAEDKQKNNLFTTYLRENFSSSNNPLDSEEQISNWLAYSSGSNAKNLLNIRFGAQAAFGFWVEGEPQLGIAGILAYPTVPHAAHNDFQLGETVLKQAAVKINLNALWKKMTHANGNLIHNNLSLNLSDEILDFRNLFNSSVIRKSAQTSFALSQGPDFESAKYHLKMGLTEVTQSDQFNVEAMMGMNDIISPVQDFNEMVTLAHWYAGIDNPLAVSLGVANDLIKATEIANNIDLTTWIRAIKSVVADEKSLYGLLKLDLKPSQATYASIQNGSVSWTPLQVKKVHEELGIATERMINNPSLPQLRLAAVMSAYGRMINSRVNFTSRYLNKLPGKVSRVDVRIVRELAERMFFKKGRFGPGNGLNLPDHQQIFLPVAGGFPMRTNYTFSNVDTDSNDLAIQYGSERQAAIIGKSANTGQYGLLMTMRYFGMEVPKSANEPFDLSTWTRDFSISRDSGRNWTPDFFIKPQYKNGNILNTSGFSNSTSSSLRPIVAGFESSEVQGSLTSVPGYFGRGTSLVLHLHPQNNSVAIINNRGTSELSLCLGDSPGDVTKSSSGCDYRRNLQLVPGKVAANWESETDPTKVVVWDFSKGITIQRGSAGYSAVTYVGRDDCRSLRVGLAYEGADEGKIEYKGFNNGITVAFVKVTGADFSFKPDCDMDRDCEPSFNAQ